MLSRDVAMKDSSRFADGRASAARAMFYGHAILPANLYGCGAWIVVCLQHNGLLRPIDKRPIKAFIRP